MARKSARIIWLLGFALSLAGSAQAETLSAREASAHVGAVATVCGVVASTKYADDANGQPTFLDFGRAFPNQLFTAVIFGNDRAEFGAPEATYLGSQICVTGMVQLYRGRPDIVVRNPSAIEDQPVP